MLIPSPGPGAPNSFGRVSRRAREQDEDEKPRLYTIIMKCMKVRDSPSFHQHPPLYKIMGYLRVVDQMRWVRVESFEAESLMLAQS